jgi:hypothetical protein
MNMHRFFPTILLVATCLPAICSSQWQRIPGPDSTSIPGLATNGVNLYMTLVFNTSDVLCV